MSREIWGIHADPRLDFDFIGRTISSGIKHYIYFARSHLGLQTPLVFEAGITGTERRRLLFNGEERGYCYDREVFYRGEISSYDTPADQVLQPFLEKLQAAFN
jgi:hypothetical protein